MSQPSCLARFAKGLGQLMIQTCLIWSFMGSIMRSDTKKQLDLGLNSIFDIPFGFYLYPNFSPG